VTAFDITQSGNTTNTFGSPIALPDSGLEQDIPQILHPKTSLEESLNSRPLSSQRVDDVVSRLDERSLEHVAEQTEDRIQGLVIGVLGAFVRHSGEQLREDGQVEDERRGEEGVFAFVEDVERVLQTPMWLEWSDREEGENVPVRSSSTRNDTRRSPSCYPRRQGRT
jgi:hypothetical protein